MVERINLADCQEIPQSPFTYITGFNIWGLSILATHNSTWTPFVNSLILSSVPYAGWTNQDGIVIEGRVANTTVDNMQHTFKVIWIRGLYEAWTRMDPTSSAAKYLKAYFYVQFNALRDLAYNADVDAYSPNWAGPSVNQQSSWGQLAALDLLNTAFAVNSNLETPSSNTTGPSSASASTGTNILGPTFTEEPSGHSSAPSRPSNSSKAAIAAGATVAGISVVAVCCFILLIARRKCARLVLSTDTPQEGTAQPYIVVPAEGQPRSKTGVSGWARLEHDPGAVVAVPETGMHTYSDSSSHRRTRPGAVNSNLDSVPLTRMMAEMRRMLATMPVPGPERVDEPPPQYYSASGSRTGTASDEPPPQYASRDDGGRVVGTELR
ncbi:hypothetical protein EIP86_001121 [Pleurotus ostreatoroseus]|nr:hypothetical protein EIP86_001121 [Pleurotus ostreatoroseus]